MNRAIKILFLAANPKDTDKLRLDEEMQRIKQALRQSEFRDNFEIEQEWAVKVADLESYLLQHKPDIVHFSDHASKLSEIILEDNTGNSQPVPVQELSQVFAMLRDTIRCVVLNACYSEPQAQAIAKHIDCVIGMSKAIGDEAVISFAIAFYQALGYGRDVKTAFDLGCAQIDLGGLDEQDTPRLLAVKSKPDEIVFALKPASPPGNRKTGKKKSIKKVKSPKWWVLAILAPIVVGLALAIVNLIIHKLSEDKFGNLQITCNSDSASIYLNNKLIGLTLKDSLITVESLEPGTHILSAEKNGYESRIFNDIKISTGITTSQYVELKRRVPPVKRFRILNFYDKALNKVIEKETGFFYDDKNNNIDFSISFKLTREIERSGHSNLFRIRKSNLAIYVNDQLRKKATEFEFPAFWAHTWPKQALEDTLRTMMQNQIINKRLLIAKYIIDCIK